MGGGIVLCIEMEIIFWEKQHRKDQYEHVTRIRCLINYVALPSEYIGIIIRLQMPMIY